ncbi:hypothetical protein U9M48_037766 [Paspalum notatum var. saurae]|uniref:Uncharacterized protein n=1 Tax=Paspalum notatum var. saurae TaxID=547442 RepID=A0AAQ3UGA5_PASNO
MNNSTSPAAAVDWGPEPDDDSAGEMDSEDNSAAAAITSSMGMGVMEVASPTSPSSSSLPPPVDAGFFNAFTDDFDDQDLD